MGAEADRRTAPGIAVQQVRPSLDGARQHQLGLERPGYLRLADGEIVPAAAQGLVRQRQSASR